MKNIQKSIANKYKKSLEKLFHLTSPDWNVTKENSKLSVWTCFVPSKKILPSHGWKIHISMSAKDCLKPFENLIPFLIDNRIAFKIPHNAINFCRINNGDCGESQIGKIITVYPASVEELKFIINNIDSKANFSGCPVVPSDVRFKMDSPIFLRFGVFFGSDFIVNENGTKEYLLINSNGEMEKDIRTTDGLQPSWAPKLPFEVYPSGLFYDQNPETIDNSFMPISLLYRSVKGDVTLGIHSSKGDTLIQKRTFTGVGSDLLGNDACSMLQNEYSVLSKVPVDFKCPKPIIFKKYPDYSILILEDIQGDVLYEKSQTEIISNLPNVANLINNLHSSGYAHNDIKLPNFIVTDSDVFLIDFELSERLGEERKIFGGTKGYFKKNKSIDVTISNDLYGFAICIVNTVLKIENSQLEFNFKEILSLLRLYGFSHAIKIVKRLTSPENQAEALKEVAPFLSKVDVSKGHKFYNRDQLFSWFGNAIESSDDYLNKKIIITDIGGYWVSEHSTSLNQIAKGINTGLAGTILGLLAVNTLSNKKTNERLIASGLDFLVNDSNAGNSTGLFCGDAGISLALISGGTKLKSKIAVSEGLNRIKKIPEKDISFDFFNGHSGILFSLTSSYFITGDEELLKKAEKYCTKIIQSYQEVNGIIIWPFADSGLTGAAHGSAGIAMALLHYAKVTRNKEAEVLGIKALKSIFNKSKEDNKESIYHNPLSDANEIAPVLSWCHGLEGYLWCLLFNEEFIPVFSNEIDWCINILSKSPVISNPCLCHGMAGQLEVWKMVSNLSQYKELSENKITEILNVLRITYTKKENSILWYSDESGIISPDLWVGFMGVMATVSQLISGNTYSIFSEKSLKRISGL